MATTEEKRNRETLEAAEDDLCDTVQFLWESDVEAAKDAASRAGLMVWTSYWTLGPPGVPDSAPASRRTGQVRVGGVPVWVGRVTIGDLDGPEDVTIAFPDWESVAKIVEAVAPFVREDAEADFLTRVQSMLQLGVSRDRVREIVDEAVVRQVIAS